MKRGVLLLVVGIAVCCASAAKDAPTSDPDAVTLMKQVVASYQAFDTYRDRGRSIQTLKFDSAEKDYSTLIIDFATLFKRPYKFKFSWTRTENFGDGSYTSKDAFWSDGSRVWSLSSDGSRAPIAEENFSMAVARATGVTRGASHEIFRLLTDKVSGFRFDQLGGLKIVRSEVISGVDCYVVHGSQYGADAYDLWIGKQDHLIRKGIDTQPDGNTVTFERMNIVVNQDIPDDQFTGQFEQ